MFNLILCLVFLMFKKLSILRFSWHSVFVALKFLPAPCFLIKEFCGRFCGRGNCYCKSQSSLLWEEELLSLLESKITWEVFWVWNCRPQGRVLDSKAPETALLCLGKGKESLFRRWRAQGENRKKREMSIRRGDRGWYERKGQGEQGCLLHPYRVYPETAMESGEQGRIPELSPQSSVGMRIQQAGACGRDDQLATPGTSPTIRTGICRCCFLGAEGPGSPSSCHGGRSAEFSFLSLVFILSIPLF